MIELLITIAKLTDRAKFPFVHWDARQTDMSYSGICCLGGGGLVNCNMMIFDIVPSADDILT